MVAKYKRKGQDLLWWHAGMLGISQEVCRIFDLPTKGCLLDLRLHGPATSFFYTSKIITHYSYNKLFGKFVHRKCVLMLHNFHGSLLAVARQSFLL